MKDIRKTQAKAIKNPTGGHYDYGRQGTSTTYILQKILYVIKTMLYPMKNVNKIIIGLNELPKET